MCPQPPPWHEALFGPEYLLLFHDLPGMLEQAEREAAFLEEVLDLAPGAAVLDAGCGFGRHAVALARRGYSVTGVDRSEALLELAMRLAAEQGVEVTFRAGDVRALAGLGPFDACVCLSTVFGYFDDATNAAVVRELRGTLRPGGQLVLDVFNPLAVLGAPMAHERVTEHGTVHELRRQEPLRARLVTERHFVGRDGRRIDYPDSDVRLYGAHELAALLERAGFELEGLFGSLTGDAFEPASSPVQVFVARRRA
jgi:2-polyprenyl-3-methyl-5-hydroxy-6-metoxy-1,4-benzoquinol methylase